MVDLEVADVMNRFVKRGACVIDAGANEGHFAWLLARLVGMEGCVYAYEPDRVVFDVLQDNIAPLKNVVTNETALWCRDEELTFYCTPESGYSSFVPYLDFERERYKVQARSLDGLGIKPTPSFIKVDCEGADEAVLRGAEQMLRSGVECVIAEMSFSLMENFQCSERTMREYMRGLGYECFLLEAYLKPLLVPHDSHIHLLESGAKNNMINVMFAKTSRVDELWT